MENKIELVQGKRLTLFQLLQDEKWSIEIPIIQREYAQGRSDEYEVRKVFISTLLEHFQSNQNIDLDFVYGSLKEDNNSLFIPLDGQQRLTTLYLLHWYLANKDLRFDLFKSAFVSDKKSRFSYETRTSSREFCDSLSNNEINLDNLIEGKVSNTLVNSHWFYYSWLDDPTIRSMLTMLDEIHEQFYNSVQCFDMLTDEKSPIVTFQFLNLDAFKLTDDLYIKMNARGKQLTTFENFKAKLEQHIKSLSFNAERELITKTSGESRLVSISEYFSFKIDTEWANLFWQYKNNNTKVFDDQLMNFLRVVAANFVAIDDTGEKNSRLKILTGKAKLSFQMYKNIIKCLEPEYVLDVVETLDLLKNDNEKIKKYLLSTNQINEDRLFEKAITNTVSYTDRIQFFALYRYIIVNQGTEGLEEWMRVIYNLSENTIYNEIDEYIIAIKSVNDLLAHSKNILEYFSTSKDRIQGFLELQVQEERIKSCLILKGTVWADKIFEIERHGYFNGQISFILNFSGIEDYYFKNSNCNWNNDVESKYYEGFILYSSKASSVFRSIGVNSFNDFILERALLTKGDYTLLSKSNNSFLVNASRDISWKRLLRDDNNGKRDCFKMLFDDVHFDISNIEQSLIDIIDQSSVDDWRKYFIEVPEIMGYLGSNKYLRWNTETNILLLKKERLNGLHAEYYSYYFWQKYVRQNKKDFLPFNLIEYIEVSGDFLPYIRFKYKTQNLYLDLSWLRSSFRVELISIDKQPLNFPSTSWMQDNNFIEVSHTTFEKYISNDLETYNEIMRICKYISA